MLRKEGNSERTIVVAGITFHHPLLAFCRIWLGVSSRRSMSDASRNGACCSSGSEQREWQSDSIGRS